MFKLIYKKKNKIENKKVKKDALILETKYSKLSR